MIWIFHRKIAYAVSADNYDDLHTFIAEKENSKLSEIPLEFRKSSLEHSCCSKWSFTFFTFQQVSVIVNIEQPPLTAIIKEAHEKGVGVIAICQGNTKKCIEILEKPDIDIGALKKQWCLAYCNAHDYMVVETFSCPRHFAPSQWQPERQLGTTRFSNYQRFTQEFLRQIPPSEILPKSIPAFQELRSA